MSPDQTSSKHSDRHGQPFCVALVASLNSLNQIRTLKKNSSIKNLNMVVVKQNFNQNVDKQFLKALLS